MDGIPILVDQETGKFSAQIGGKTVERKELNDIEREIRKLRRAIKVIAVGHSSRHGPFVWEITAFENDKWLTASGDVHSANSFSVYPYSDELLKELEAIKVEDQKLAELNHALNQRWYAALKPHKSMWRSDLPWSGKVKDE